MKNFILKILGSFDNHSKYSFSARKLSAFAGVMIGYYETTKIQNDLYRLYAVGGWLLFALLCLSIVTASQLISLKNEVNLPPNRTDAN